VPGVVSVTVTAGVVPPVSAAETTVISGMLEPAS
jgi:hypothetical protein